MSQGGALRDTSQEQIYHPDARYASIAACKPALSACPGEK